MAFKQTKCFKWLDNFWYHYKVHTLVGLFLAFVVIFSAVQLLTIQSYDYYVILYSTDTTSTDLSQGMAYALEQYGEDLDSDGEVTVQILNMSYNPSSDSQSFQIAQSGALNGELQNDRCYLFITDDYRFEELDKRGLFAAQPGLDDHDGKGLQLNDTQFMTALSDYLQSIGLSGRNIPTLWMSCRVPPEQNTTGYTHYQQAANLLQQIRRQG